MQLGPRWRGLYPQHLSREEDWVLLIPSQNQKPYLPNLWCEDSNQEMIVGKCYCGYVSLTLDHEKGSNCVEDKAVNAEDQITFRDEEPAYRRKQDTQRERARER